MILIRILPVVFSITLLVSTGVFADDAVDVEQAIKPTAPMVGSWIFSGLVTNESGERYGYFFQMQRQGAVFHAKTALIDGQTNKLVFFYEGKETIDKATALDWHVGRSFIRYNPISDSWIFGVKVEDNKGFNFKVDIVQQAKNENEILVLRPGVELQALQTSRLNGHVHTGSGAQEQFVTGNKAWFGKLWFSKDQKTAHEISTTFCRLSNETGFYSANLKESDATGAAVAGWRDAAGSKVKMSQFVSIKTLMNNESQLNVLLPKLSLKLFNTLTHEDNAPLSIAGFTKDNPTGFCFVADQSLTQTKETAAVG
ncbi:MAG: hypothetical protein ACHP65_04215 [Legionellales bacterium]